MSYGLMKAGIRVVAALDNDPQCQETYKANHPEVDFLLEDITNLSTKKFSTETGIQRNDDEMIFIGCSPCQFWSIINGKARVNSMRKRKSRDSRNLLRDFLRFVKFYKPGFVIVENVRGMELNPDDSGLSDLLNFFKKNGYSVDKSILAFSDFGVPQKRRRFVLIASRVVLEIHLPKPIADQPKTVQQVIGDLPKIKAGETCSNDSLHRASSLTEKNLARLQMTPEGGTRSSWVNSSKLQINAYKGKPLHFFSENYGRMSWDALSPTITTKFFSIGCGRFGHPDQDRSLSLREGALLQTFPLSYKFKIEGLAPTARIIGNAVPPEFSHRLGLSIITQAKKSGVG